MQAIYKRASVEAGSGTVEGLPGAVFTVTLPTANRDGNPGA
jgi:hypothetical protein